MHTYTRWVSTPENRSPLFAVQRVAECVCSGRDRREANPLFLHGPAGTGKTHLVHALANDVYSRCPDKRTALLPAQDLDPLAIGDNPAEASEGTGSNADVLIIEDLQHLPTRAAEALVHRFDEHQSRQRQMVFTALVGPRQLDALPARLLSRLASGLVVRLQPLGREGRLAFLRDRTQLRHLAVGADVLSWLADHVGGSGRQLEGAITRLETLVRTHDRLPDVATVAAWFQADAQAARPSMERITERVSHFFRVDPRKMQSRQRSHCTLVPRQVSMYLARQYTSLSLGQIGAYFGGRDHSTVLHACHKVDHALTNDVTLSGAVRQLQGELCT